MDHAAYSGGSSRQRERERERDLRERERPPMREQRDGYRDRERVPIHRRPSFEDDRYARRPNYYASSLPPPERERSFTQQRDARSVRDPRERESYPDRDRQQRAREDSFSSSTAKDYNNQQRESSPPPQSARWKGNNTQRQQFRNDYNKMPDSTFERERPRTDDLGRSNSGRPRSLSPVNQAYSNGRSRVDYPSGSVSARDAGSDRYDRERIAREREREDRFQHQRDNNNNWNNRRRPSYPPPSPARYYDDHPSASASSTSSSTGRALPPPPSPANTVIGKRTRGYEEMEEREYQQQQQRQARPASSSYTQNQNQNRPTSLQFGSVSSEGRQSSVSRGSEAHSASDKMSNGWPVDDSRSDRTSNTATPIQTQQQAQDGPRTPPPRSSSNTIVANNVAAEVDEEEEEGELSDNPTSTSPRLPSTSRQEQQSKMSEVQVKQEMLETSLAARISTVSSVTSSKSAEAGQASTGNGGSEDGRKERRTPSPRPKPPATEQPSSTSQNMPMVNNDTPPKPQPQQQQEAAKLQPSTSSTSIPSPRTTNPELRPLTNNTTATTSPNTPPLPKVNINLTSSSSNIRNRLSDAAIPTSPRAMRRDQELSKVNSSTSPSSSSTGRSLAERLSQPAVPSARQSPSPRPLSWSLIENQPQYPIERRVTSPPRMLSSSTSSPSCSGIMRDQQAPSQPSTRSLLERIGIEPAVSTRTTKELSPKEPQSASYQRSRTTSAPSPSLPKSPNVPAREVEEVPKIVERDVEAAQTSQVVSGKDEKPRRENEPATPPREPVEAKALSLIQEADRPSLPSARNPDPAEPDKLEQRKSTETAIPEPSPRAASIAAESATDGSEAGASMKPADDEGFTDGQQANEQAIDVAEATLKDAEVPQEAEILAVKEDVEMEEADIQGDISADGTIIEHSSMEIDVPEQPNLETGQPVEAVIKPSSPLAEAILAEHDISLDGTDQTEDQTEEQNIAQVEEVQDEPHEQQASEDEEMEVDEPEVDAAFVQMLGSLIEAEESKGDTSAEADLSMDIIKRNKAKAPIQLPLAVQKLYQGMDLLEVKEIVFENHLRLETFLIDEFQARDIERGNQIFRLRAQYKELDQDWSVHCNKLEKIRTRQKRRQTAQAPPMTPSLDSSSSLPFLSATPATPSILAPSGRANRRNAASSLGYGDAARSEAEFLEILASLEDADMRDPNLRAMRTTATVPDMAIDAGEHGILQDYDDCSGLVTDPFEHYGLNKKPDAWTEDEIATFCRRYALFPKQFGKIAASLPDKTTAQCVLFYYRSKKKINFRALVDKRSVNGKRKRKVGLGEKGTDDDTASGGDKKKGSSLLSNLKRSKENEMEEDDYDEEPQTPGSAMAAVSAAVDAVALPAARALIDQLNSESDGPTRPASKMMLGEEYKHSNSRSNSNKKAARFLSPPASQHAHNEDGPAPASDGAIAAAEALGVLAGLADPTSSTTKGGKNPLSASTPGLGQKKKRKPSMSEPMTDLSFGDGSTPKSAAGPAKRSRPHSSSYWSVADKNEFVRLLGVHGKNYQAIADGIPSKTAVQCKNFFQNNLKKLGLAQIVADVEEGVQAKPEEDGQAQPDALRQIPSVFGKPNGHATQPPAGFFSSPQTAKAERENIVPNHPASRGGGMNLHNLLDDAPDAEGGAHDPFRFEQRAEGQQAQGMPTPSDVLEDSSTEDEAEPRRFATHMQQHVRRSSDILPMHRTISPQTLPPDPSLQHHQHERSLSYQYQQPPHSARTYGQQAHHARSISDSRRSPTFSLREPLSSPFPSVLSERRPGAYTSFTAPPNGSRYGSIPPSLPPSSRTWSPYDSPSYGQQAPLARDFYSSRSGKYEDLPPLSARTYHPPSSYAAAHSGRNLGIAQDGATYTKAPAGLPHQIQSPASYGAHGSYFDSVNYPPHQRPPHHTSSARSSSASNIQHNLPPSGAGVNGSGASTPTDPARSPVDHPSYYQRYENQPPLAHSRRNSAQQP